MAGIVSLTVSRDTGATHSTRLFKEGRRMFNFPTERMAPMADIEALEKVGGIIRDGQEFEIDFELKKIVFFKAISEGLGWAINNWPEITKISGPYDFAYRIDCICKFDSRDASRTTEVETIFMVPEGAFHDALAFGLNTIMGNVQSAEIKNLWSCTDSVDVIIRFKAKEQN